MKMICKNCTEKTESLTELCEDCRETRIRELEDELNYLKNEVLS